VTRGTPSGLHISNTRGPPVTLFRRLSNLYRPSRNCRIHYHHEPYNHNIIQTSMVTVVSILAFDRDFGDSSPTTKTFCFR